MIATIARVRRSGAVFRFRPKPLSRTALLASFAAIVPLAMGLDSPALLRAGFDGQPLDAVIVPAFLALLLAHVPRERRLLVLLVVPVTAVGEVLLSVVLRLYVYKFDGVPLYVPFGHATLFASTLLLSQAPVVLRHEWGLRRALLAGYALLGVAAVVAGDTFSLLLALPFGYALWRSRARLFYLLMGALVLYVECTGALLGCWRWLPQPFGLLSTTNPPLAVYTIYVLGDAGLLRLAKRVQLVLVRLGDRRSAKPLERVMLWLGLRVAPAAP